MSSRATVSHQVKQEPHVRCAGQPATLGRMGGLVDQLSWRLVGPHRGGRVVAVAGHPAERTTFYFGSTGGGVWGTTDAGITWRNPQGGFGINFRYG